MSFHARPADGTVGSDILRTPSHLYKDSAISRLSPLSGFTGGEISFTIGILISSPPFLWLRLIFAVREIRSAMRS